VYRLPSVLASIGTIVLAGLIGLRQSRLEGCIAVILTSWSYLLIHFGTEARGYSLVIFFALLAWYALQQFEEKRSWLWIIVFWGAVVLGFLAHLEFAICFAALVAWALWRFVAIDRNGDRLCSTRSRFSQCRSRYFWSSISSRSAEWKWAAALNGK